MPAKKTKTKKVAPKKPASETAKEPTPETKPLEVTIPRKAKLTEFKPPPKPPEKEAAATPATVAVSETEVVPQNPPSQSVLPTAEAEPQVFDSQTPVPVPVPETEGGPSPQRRLTQFFFAVVVFLITLGVAGLISLLLTQKAKEETLPIASPADMSPSPEPLFDRSLFLFEVLNGSGVPGAAARAAEKLEGLGYDILEVGNATSSAYLTSKLYVSETLLTMQQALLDDLAKEFDIATVSGMLEESQESTATARMIVGRE